MEDSTNMISDMYEQSLHSDSNPGQLNTPSPPVINNDAEYRTERNWNNESLPSTDLMDLYSNLSVPSNDDLLHRTETIIADVQELKQSNVTIKATLRRQKKSCIKIEAILHKQEQSIIRIEAALSKQEQMNEKISTMLEQLIQSNILNNKTSQRFVSPKPNVPDFPLSTDERPIGRSNQEASMNRNRNFMENNQERHTTFSPSESNFIAAGEDRNQIRRTTTNELNLYTTDAIDKILSEKNRGKIQIGQWCYEINVGTTDDAPALITATNHASSTIPANSSVQHENQSQHAERATENGKPSSSNSINYQLSRQLKMTSGNLLSALTVVGSTKLCLLHPLEQQINSKADRTTVLTDCFGNAPILIVCGDSLPVDTRVEMAMIFASSKGCYYSIYRFPDKKSGYKDLESRAIETNNYRPQRIELNDLKVCKRCNNNMKNKETFTLKRYPSGETEDTMIDGPKELNDKYNCKHIQLAIRCFQNDRLLLNGTIFYSNLLFGVSKIQPSHYRLDISIIYPLEKVTSFDCNNQCQMEFLIKIPEPFHCTLISGYKWFEISIITNNSLNPIYSIDTGNGDNKNPNYIHIEHDSFKMPFKIIKQTLSELMNNKNMPGPNRFHIQIRLLHGEVRPSQSSKEYYTNCATWESKEFIENIVSTSLQQETARNIGLKRTNEVICDYSLGLPSCKERKTSENTS